MTQNGDGAESSGLTAGMLLSRRTKFALVLYLVFPLFAGFISAMQGSGRTSGWPLGFRVAYYIPLALIVMWSSGLSCYLLSKPFKALRLPLWSLLIVGVLVAGEFIKLYVSLIVPVFDKLLPSSATGGRVAEFTFFGNLQAGIPTIITWLCLNMIAWYLFKIERFGYQPPATLAGMQQPGSGSDAQDIAAPLAQDDNFTSPVPNFIKRANLTSVDQLKAIEAQQHYIKIHTDVGTKTILYRFSDAIGELGKDQGVRVHRSWWVNRNSVGSTEEEGNRMTLVLKTGIRVPVSRTYHLQASEIFQPS